LQKFDLIIVGQGLAGSVLALRLIEKDQKILVIDQPELSSCSSVAAGIWNPVVFKRLTRSWMIDELFPEMNDFYKKAENILGVSLVTERHIIKIFSEQQEVELWKKKANGELSDYLDKTIYQDEIAGIKTGKYGYSKVFKAGNLKVKTFLESTREFLENKNSFLAEEFDWESLRISETIQYKNFSAGKIVFAEGYLVKNNPYFNYIPMKPAKGEVLLVKIENSGPGKDIINKNAFIMPLGDGINKVGATYNWSDLNDKPSGEGLEELQNKLAKITTVEYEIMEHKAGVRPSVIDRRPVLGSHKVHKNLYLFNGMGTKGVMLAPYFAEKLADHIMSGKEIPPEVSLSRFDSDK